MINDKVEESLSLDYKRADALIGGKGDQLTKEVTKDVSAFANSAGGIIIYGIAEGSGDAKHLPVSLSPISRRHFSKERLEHLINNIQPKVAGIEIIPISLSSAVDDAAYVVSIPASTTAHQCTDKRYYRRHNFEAVMMEDYEIRDVMNRNRFPILTLEVVLQLFYTKPEPLIGGMPSLGRSQGLQENFWWTFNARNIGGTVANYLQGSFSIPQAYLHDHGNEVSFDHMEFSVSNFLRTTYGSGLYTKASEPEYKRVLPLCDLELCSHRASPAALLMKQQEFAITWKLFCDNAPPQEGVLTADDILVEMNDAFEREMAKMALPIERLEFTKVKKV